MIDRWHDPMAQWARDRGLEFLPDGLLPPWTQTLEGKLVGEIGTRTRQAGVPLHAIVGTDALDGFGKRMIDLQLVQEATDLPELEAAGERLGRALATGEA